MSLPRLTDELINTWLSALNFEEDRQIYAAMTKRQKQIVRFAMLFGMLNPPQKTPRLK